MDTQILPTSPDNGGQWDAGWAALQGDMVQLYTRHPPRTLQQFWQRCYFEDLWGCMGSGATKANYLELGAGRGTTSMYLASRGCDVTMVDLSASGFDVARANFLREGLRLPKMILADARQTGLPPESYDCIFSIGLLEHFIDPKPVIVETLRLLRPGGFHFSVIIPNRPLSAYYLAHAMFCPWVLAYELLPDRVQAAIRKVRGRPRTIEEGDVLRTSYDRDVYLRLVQDLEVLDARCIPYNSYHPVYQSPLCEEWISIPAYSAHRTLTKLFKGHPLMSTAAALASCGLLTFRKRG